MNPLTNIKNQQKLNQTELALGLTGKKSWHDQYKDSAWIFIGGLPFDLTEGDVLCVFSQYGEIVNVNLVRDQKSGKSKGFCFICYENQRSTILAVDNLNGIKLLGRMIRVDHVEEYRKPKEHGDEDEITKKLRAEGCAPKIQESPERISSEDEPPLVKVKVKKEKKVKVKKEKKIKKKKRKQSSSEESESDSDDDDDKKMVAKGNIKKERKDPGYDKALNIDKRSSKRSHSPDMSERRKSSKYSKDYSEDEQIRERNYHDSDRHRDREVSDQRNSRNFSTDRDNSERDWGQNYDKYGERGYVDRGHDMTSNKDGRNRERYNNGKDDNRTFDRNHRDSREYEQRYNKRDTDGNRDNREEMKYKNRDNREDEQRYNKRDTSNNREDEMRYNKRDSGGYRDNREDEQRYKDRDTGGSRERRSYNENKRKYNDDRGYNRKDSYHSSEKRDRHSDNYRDYRR
ncbi:RNA-binding motif protein [Mactra antiquata]